MFIYIEPMYCTATTKINEIKKEWLNEFNELLFLLCFSICMRYSLVCSDNDRPFSLIAANFRVVYRNLSL